jgi:hypothetical protein
MASQELRQGITVFRPTTTSDKKGKKPIYTDRAVVANRQSTKQKHG